MSPYSALRLLLVVIVAVSGGGFTTAAAPRGLRARRRPSGRTRHDVIHPAPASEGAVHVSRRHEGQRNLGVNERHVSTANHPDVSEPIENGDTRMIAVTLPQGEYEFFRWRVHEFGSYLQPTVDFSVRFKSMVGKAVYIGNRLVPMVGRRFSLLVRDQREGEIPLFRKHYPKITDTQIETHLMHVVHSGRPLELFPPLTFLPAR
jgi:hypothetical protein